MRSDPNARWLEELGATPRRVALIYAALAAAWILLSDRIVDALVSDSGLISAIQTIKGWLFVAVSAIAIYLIVRRPVALALAAESDRRRDAERFRDFAEAASDWFWETGPDMRFTYISERADGRFSFVPSSMIGRTRDEMMAPEMDPEQRQRHREDLEERRSFRDFHYVIDLPDGTRGHVRVSGKPHYDDDGTFLGYRGASMNVTAAFETRAARERLASIVEASPNFVATAQIDGRVLYINTAGRAMVGLSVDEDVTGLDILDLYPPEFARRLRDEILPAVMRGRNWSGEAALRRRDGRDVPMLQELIVHRDSEAAAPYLSIIAVDLTDRLDAERALRERERQYRAIFESASDGLLIFDADGRLAEVNPAGCAILGYDRTEMIGRPSDAFIHPDDRYKLEEFIGAVQRSGSYYNRARLVRKDGSTVMVEAKGRSFTYNGAPHILAAARDVTERDALESRLQQAQRMESIGQLTGGMAHDFNNLLVVVLGSAELLVRRMANDLQGRQLAEAIVGASRRAADLTGRLLAFARRQSLRPEPVSLNALIADMEPILRRTLGEDIGIETRLDPDLWTTSADRAQLEAGILNLAINARDAMPEGGRLTIETRNVSVDRASVERLAEFAPGDYVVMSVTDSGVGMTPEVAGRAFEPFFTTKAPGRGTGLGLSMVYGFARQSGGQATIYSEPGIGTTVRLYLPRHGTPVAAAAAPAEDRSVAASTGETLLVVEDDDAVREFVVEQLRALGYRVLEASNGAAALMQFDAHPEVALLMTDVVMPGGMSGPQLAAEAVRRRPDLKVLFTSGYADPAVLARARLDPSAPMLAKPYRYAELVRAVRDALDRRPA